MPVKQPSPPLSLLQGVCALAMLIGFFLPWFHNPHFTVSACNAGRFFRFLSEIRPVSPLLQMIVWLIVPGALTVLLLVLLKKSSGAACMITGMLPAVVLIVLLVRGSYIIPQIASGMVLSLSAGLVLLILGAIQTG